MSMRKRTARNTHKAEIRFIRFAHIVIAVECIGVYACAYLLPRRYKSIQSVIIIAYEAR